MRINKIYLVGYRDWSIKIINEFENFDSVFKITSKNQWDKHKYDKSNIYIFIGWSWIISLEFIKNKNCYCIHPSSLPLYRGGSPIQNQIIDGVNKSSVTLFQMNELIDGGDIFDSEPIFLDGYLDEIFQNIVLASIKLINQFISKVLSGKPFELKKQNLMKGSLHKRRKPEDSIYTLADLSEINAKKFYDLVRCLQNPYPELKIMFNDGSIVIIKNAEIKK